VKYSRNLVVGGWTIIVDGGGAMELCTNNGDSGAGDINCCSHVLEELSGEEEWCLIKTNSFLQVHLYCTVASGK
jgi:hypothetical protein